LFMHSQMVDCVAGVIIKPENWTTSNQSFNPFRV